MWIEYFKDIEKPSNKYDEYMMKYINIPFQTKFIGKEYGIFDILEMLDDKESIISWRQGWLIGL